MRMHMAVAALFDSLPQSHASGSHPSGGSGGGGGWNGVAGGSSGRTEPFLVASMPAAARERIVASVGQASVAAQHLRRKLETAREENARLHKVIRDYQEKRLEQRLERQQLVMMGAMRRSVA